jgi:hypothetical protein
MTRFQALACGLSIFEAHVAPDLLQVAFIFS